MELRQYAALLRKWLWLVILSALVAGGASYVISRHSTPIYQASATLMVNQGYSQAASSAYADLLTSQMLAETYANLLTSRPVLDDTAAQLGVAVDGLEDAIKVTAMRDTQLLEIAVEGPNPELVARIANTLPEKFIERNLEMQVGRVTQAKESLEKEIASTEADIARTQVELQRASGDAQKARLETSLAQYRTTYSTLVASYQQVRLAEAQATNNIVVAEPAVVPDSPIRPRTLTNILLAVVLGALIALAAAFVIEYLDDTVKTPDDVQQATGLSTLGAIARLKGNNGAQPLVAWARTKAPESEAYRALRTNIQFSGVDKPIRTLLVTSSSPGEGKSTTAANLAIVMAQTGQRIVVVDTDLRRPVLHRIFGVPNNTGLTSTLLARGNLILADQLQPTEIASLHVLTSGPVPPNPSELLGSHRMASLIEELSEQADIVIFDSPPVLAVTDAAVLGRQLDGVLLVADAGQTREQVLAGAVGELYKAGVNVLGVALNRLNGRRGGHQYYYYYYYSEEETGQRRRLPAMNETARARWPWQRKPA